MTYKLEVGKRIDVSEDEFHDIPDVKYYDSFKYGNFTEYDQTVRRILYLKYRKSVDEAIEKNPKKLTDIIYENWKRGIDADITANHLGSGVI